RRGAPNDNGRRGLRNSELHGRERVAHVTGLVASGRRVAQAELPEHIAPPTLHPSIDEQRAGVRVPAAYAPCRNASTQVHGWQVVAHLPGSAAALVRVPDAELAIRVIAPAFDAAVVQERADVRNTGAHRDRRLAASQVDWREIGAHLIR